MNGNPVPLDQIITAADIESVRAVVDREDVKHDVRQAAQSLVDIATKYGKVHGDARNNKALAEPAIKARLEGYEAEIRRLNEYLQGPEYKHDGTGGDVAARSLGGAVGPQLDRPRVLTGEQKAVSWLADRGVPVFDEEFRLGYLGARIKALMGEPDDLARYEQHLPAFSAKDSLSTGFGELLPEPIAADLIDALRSASVLFESGARLVPMDGPTLRVPRAVTDPVPSWVGEGAPYPLSDPDVDAVTFTARKLAAITRVGEELLEDSSPVEMGRVVREGMARSFALELDRAGLRGSGTAPEPRGIRFQTGVSVTPGAGVIDWDDLANAAATVRGANRTPTGFITSVRTDNSLSQLKASGTGEYLLPPVSIADIARRATTAVPTNIGASLNESEVYTGQFDECMIGARIRFELRNLVERYADEGLVGIRARIRADVQLRHGASFAVLDGVLN